MIVKKRVYLEKKSIMPGSCGLPFSTVITLLSGIGNASLKASLILTLG